MTKRDRKTRKRRKADRTKAGDGYEDAVAEVARTLYPAAHIEVGQWVEGPDGLRDLDVSVHPAPGAPADIVIECKDWTRPVGIGVIDALESKRRDLGAPTVLICSNSGFTEDALRKAERVGIPALAALKKGDSRIKIVVKHLLYTRDVTFAERRHVHVDHIPFPPGQELLPSAFNLDTFQYNGRPLVGWFGQKLLNTVATHVTKSGPVSVKIRFKEYAPIKMAGFDLKVTAFTAKVTVTVEWRSQTINITASNGMYDFLRKVLVVGDGAQFEVQNLDVIGFGKTVDVEDVPKELFVPIAARRYPRGVFFLELLRARNAGWSDIVRAPNMDSLVSGIEISIG